MIGQRRRGYPGQGPQAVQKNIVHAVDKDRARIENIDAALQQMDQSGWTADLIKKYL